MVRVGLGQAKGRKTDGSLAVGETPMKTGSAHVCLASDAQPRTLDELHSPASIY